jgi:WD40 repeat protein
MHRALARVRSSAGDLVGSGFLVDSGHVVTCTHVVMHALGRRDDTGIAAGDVVTVDFPLVAQPVVMSAEVVVAHPIEHDGGGDVAVLALADPAPASLEPARLVIAEEFWGHPFRAYGFPRRIDDGVWISGTLRAPQGTGWVQMEGGVSGYAVEPGFSGGAVWDEELAGVVGMTVAADTRSDLRVAFLIPTTALLAAWPDLAERALPPCPYRGLHPFRVSDAALFAGRDELTERLMQEVRRRPLVAVVGPSGSGKSSIVFAGVIPRLDHEGGWVSLGMRPSQGSSPLFALAAALAPVLEPDQSEVERLTTAGALDAALREGRLDDVVDRVLARSQASHALIVVDQMEELFTRGQDEVEAFVSGVLAALRRPSHQPDGPLTVVLTLRADFLSNALQNPQLAEALENSVFTIGQMRAEQMRAAIEQPLPPGVAYQSGLVERILDDVGDEPGRLPLLEFALTLLWERQEAGVLSHAAYQQLGGVDGALASYAERVYSEQLLPEDQDDARRLFVQLVRPSEIGPPIRRLARRPELGDTRWQLGQRLAATRLLIADRDAGGAESVELVHEALIDGWARLQQWIEVDSAFRAWQERLRGALAAWEGVQREPGALLRGAPLAEAERWREERPADLGETERQFIRESRDWRGRSVRRLRTAVAALTALLLVATCLGGVAVWQSVKAAEQARLAGSRLLLNEAGQRAGQQPDVAMLLAAAAYRMSPTPDAAGLITQMAGSARQVDEYVHTTAGTVLGAEFDRTDPNVMILYGQSTITTWDIQRRSPIRQWTSTSAIARTVMSADGRAIAVQQTDPDGETIVLWYPGENRPAVPLPHANVTDDPAQTRMAFDPGATALAICTPAQVEVWDLATRQLRTSRPKRDQSCGVGFTGPDRLVYVDEGELRLWDLREDRIVNHTAVVSPTGLAHDPTHLYTTVAVAPDGRTGLVDDDSLAMSAWDLRTLAPLGVLGQDISGDVSFTPDSRWAVVGTATTATLIDMSTSKPVRSFEHDSGNPFDAGDSYAGPPLSLSPDGRRLAFLAGGGTLALLGIDGSGDPAATAKQIAVASGTPDRLVTADATGAVRSLLADAGDVQTLVPPSVSEPGREVLSALAPDGRHFAVRDEQQPGQVVLTDLGRLDRPVTRLGPDDGTVTALTFDASEGGLLASADASTVTVRSVDTGAVHGQVRLDGLVATGLAMGREGRLVAVHDQAGNVHLGDTVTRAWTTLPITGTRALSFSPDGRWLGARTASEVRIWDLDRNCELLQPLPAPTRTTVSAAKFSRDGEYIAAARIVDDKVTLSVWRVESGELVGGVGGYVRDFAFLPDGHRLAVASNGAFITPFEPAWALRTICRVVVRDLTADEWSQYAGTLDQVAACP